MGIYFKDALCRKCPYYGKKPCKYKINFYKRVRIKRLRYKLTHKCQQYKKIFSIGQTVQIDLYHRIINKYGERVEVLAHKNVPGVIRAVCGCKYRIDLFEPYVVMTCKRRRRSSLRSKVIFKCSKNAKDIRPLDIYTTSVLEEKEQLYLWKKRHR